MARRTIAGGGLALALALVLAAPASEAQSPRPWGRPGPAATPSAAPPPPPGAGQSLRAAPRLPDYYLERRGPVATPNAPVLPGGVESSLRARGFRDIAPPQQRGKTTIIPQATGPSGERVQLIIGPRGEIVGVRVLGPDGLAPVPGRR